MKKTNELQELRSRFITLNQQYMLAVNSGIPLTELADLNSEINGLVARIQAIENEVELQR